MTDTTPNISFAILDDERAEREASVANKLPNWNKLHPNLRRSIAQQKERLFAMKSVEGRLERTTKGPILPPETFIKDNQLDPRVELQAEETL